jgi:hypothetical protein
MSEIQEIDVFISPEGEVKIEVRGVKGKKCLEITRGLENALGGKVVLREHTDEFNQNEQDIDQSAFQGQF